MMQDNSTWFYVRDNAQAGPVSGVEIIALIENGDVTKDTLVWCKAMPGWLPARETELAGHFVEKPAPPPLPPLPPRVETTSNTLESQYDALFGSAQPAVEETKGAPLDFSTPQTGKHRYADALHPRTIGFAEAVSLAFTNYFNFSGRAQRSEFWWFQLFCLIVTVVATLISEGAGNLAMLVLLIPSISQSVRRLRDIGVTGWSAAFAIIILPILYFLALQESKRY